MANEVISTFTTSPYLLDFTDSLYIAETGRILVSLSNANALSNRTPADAPIDIAVDGSVISVSGMAINLSRLLATDPGSYTLVIGASGLVRSVTDNAVQMKGSGSTVVNGGEIGAGFYGVYLEGGGSEVSNSGVIQAGVTGITMLGNFNQLVNTGDVTAPLAIYMQGSNLTLLNSGTLSGQLFGSVVGTPGAVAMQDYSNCVFTNSGQIRSSNAGGLSFVGASESALDFDNTGDIAGNSYGVSVSAAGDGAANLMNGGHIIGADYGMTLSLGDFFVNNTETGVITSTGFAGLRSSATLNLTNSGTIAASGHDTVAILLGSASAFSSLTNTGTISSNFAAAIDARAVLTGGSVFLTNFGSILGTYQGGAVRDVLINRGLMSAVNTGDGADILRNRDLISSFVALGNGNDVYDGRRGEVDDWVDGGQNDDLLRGGLNEDDLRGGTGNDTVLGGDGDDILLGSLGLDDLSAGDGNDTLDGGADQDLLSGGAGADLFIFVSAAEAGTATNKDRISDFNLGNDMIDLSAFMAGGRFIGSAVFSNGGISEVRYQAATGLLLGDVGGNGTVDWRVVLTNAPSVTAADFIF